MLKEREVKIRDRPTLSSSVVQLSLTIGRLRQACNNTFTCSTCSSQSSKPIPRPATQNLLIRPKQVEEQIEIDTDARLQDNNIR
jgi:hypothetical protein